MKTTLKLFFFLLIFNSSLLFSAPQENEPLLEKVKLQLKWLHQFQFAGYYAAKEQGYYASEGLDVDIFERSPDKDVTQQVVSGEMDFAVGDSGILASYANGEPIAALAAIFQHDPLVFISKQSSGIISPYQMSGKRIMFDSIGSGDSSLLAMLVEARLTEKDYTVVKQSFNNDDLIDGKVDVMSAYLGVEMFYFQQKNIKINIINPPNYGVDFYGDLLFTSQHELTQHQGRAERFRRASLKGWQYAIDHTEELVQLIDKKYHSRLSVAHLRFEAETTRKLMLLDAIPIGQIDTKRLHQIAEVYTHLNFSNPLTKKEIGKFITPFSRSDDKPLIACSEYDFSETAFEQAGGTAGGFAVELWRAVATDANVISTIQAQSWSETLQSFKNGECDVVLNMGQSNKRSQFADYSVPHSIKQGAIFARHGERTIYSETDLKNKRIIVVRSALAQEYADSKGWAKQLVLVDGPDEAFKLLASGQFDVVLMNKLTGSSTLKNLKISTIEALPISVGMVLKLSFAVHKGEAELLAKINEGLASMKVSGTYDKLYEKWFGVYEEKQLLPLVIKYLAPIIIVFLLILFVVFYLHHLERQKAAKQLAQRERHLRAILSSAPTCIKMVARDGTLLSMNPAGLALIEAGLEEDVQNFSLYPIIAPEYHVAFQAFNETVCDGNSGIIEFEMIGLQGTRHWMESRAVPFSLENGEVVQLAFTQEITERKQTEVQLRIAATVFESQAVGMTITDASTKFIKVNQAFTKMTGYSEAETLNKKPRMLSSGRHDSLFFDALWQSVRACGGWQGEIWNKRKNGDIYPELITITAVRANQDEQITHYVATHIDITKRKAAEEEIKQLAFYDPLTGLPNRRKLLDRLQYAIALNHRSNTQFAVFMMDLDKFKAVNDKLGHAAGDELLKQVAARITGGLRDSDMVARLGGDEFVLVLENLKIPTDVEAVALKVIADLTIPFQLSETDSMQIGASIGISIYPQHGSTFEMLMDHADAALYQAKANGRGCFSYFSEVSGTSFI